MLAADRMQLRRSARLPAGKPAISHVDADARRGGMSQFMMIWSSRRQLRLVF
jgi:hypothetical protein